jgi:hypothetical protein
MFRLCARTGVGPDTRHGTGRARRGRRGAPRFGGTIDEVEEEQEFEHRRCTAWLEKARSRATTPGTPVRVMHRSGHPAQHVQSVLLRPVIARLGPAMDPAWCRWH